MVYIHGEGYESGDPRLYHPAKLVKKGIILVTFSYRLGILGFLSTDNEAASGNWGLYDQNLALRWIQLNIGALGGNPSHITLFGQGSGAASVFFHLISPLSQGNLHILYMLV